MDSNVKNVKKVWTSVYKDRANRYKYSVRIQNKVILKDHPSGGYKNRLDAVIEADRASLKIGNLWDKVAGSRYKYRKEVI